MDMDELNNSTNIVRRKTADEIIAAAKARAAAAQARLDAKKSASEDVASAGAQTAQEQRQTRTSTLMPELHKNRDFFVADIVDAAAKDDLASMEHPLFALKAGDTRVRTYERNGVTVKVMPGTYGCATIHDKDIWIYCVSQLVEAMNRGREDVERTVRFTAYDFLVATNRPTAGVGYQRMCDALGRLSGTRIETNIETAGQRERAGFGLVDSWRVIERAGDGRMSAVEVTLPDWLYRAVQARQVLTINRDYFRIRKPVNRRIYEIARKHCGGQRAWRISLSTLHQKSGSTGTLRAFRDDVAALAAANDLPDYALAYERSSDIVTFKARDSKMRSLRAESITRAISAALS